MAVTQQKRPPQSSRSRTTASGPEGDDRNCGSVILGHKSRDVTTDYSVAELASLIEAANRVILTKDSPALTVIRLAA